MKTNLLQPNKYMPTIIQLLTPLAVFLGLGAEWYWWAVAVVFFLAYRMIGHGVGLHRYYCHKQFTISRFSEWFIGWFSLMSCVGSPSSYTLVHLVHHKYTDTPLDPHGPQNGIRSILYWFWNPPLDLEKTPIFTRRLTELMPYMWIHNFYWPLIALNAFVLYLISWKLFLFAWWIPMSFTIWELVFSVYISHWHLGVHAPVNHNNYSGRLLPFHEYLHRTHHIYPNLGNQATGPQEFDYTYHLCRLFAREWRQETLDETTKA